MANKKVRVLVAGVIGAMSFRCNDVANLPDVLIKAHADAVDTNKESVAYALEQSGGVVIEYVDPVEAKAAQVAVLEDEIAKLEAALAEATDVTRPAFEQVIATKRAEIAALG